ncbi:ATP-binding protein [Modestobacter roseus]|uniref:ATP-dependent DNA helicase RecG n=1 Tax=Modestobacter roseus TaxID=1181884 RepID=A0A562IUN4_9ACTN|nr:ATP-binding protein [Modestobacter roseus]MQA32833.1 helix-turn-helix domain-containing protein [Modestobacter roseus]TWH74717.1 ATP-dependent DNA helicase RecG [Modestobacter roseus]
MTANEVDAALSAPRAEVGKRLLGLIEDQWFDRKSIKLAAKDVAVPLTAFANAEGGTLVIGLHNGKVEGTRTNRKKLNDLRQAPIDFTVPPVRALFEEVPCVNDAGEDDELLVARIDPGERVHELPNGDCYLRIGDESRRLNYQQRTELEFDKGQAQYDGFAAKGVTASDLDSRLLENYRERVGSTGTVTGLLQARSLLTRAGEMTNAGYLLFGKNPQDLFPQAFIRVVKFLDVERGTGARLGIEEGSDYRIEGPIPWAIQEASRIIEREVPSRRRLVESGRFEGRPIVPRDAWLEGLVNAVIHRSYSLAGDHIRVEIYPNRVEIESPGRFPGLANPAKPLEISRFARNPRVARVCADLRIGQELGEGIKRIFEEMRRVGLTDPVYKQSGGSVRLFLQAVPSLDVRVAARLPKGSQQVLDILRASDRALGTGDIAEALGYSRPATTARLRALEAEDLIRWNGKSPKDPRAVWILNE